MSNFIKCAAYVTDKTLTNETWMNTIHNCEDSCDILQNEERRTRTVVYVLMVTEEMSEWEDSKNIGRRRKWFGLEEAFEQLAQHKPIQLDYLQHMRLKHKV